MLIGISNYKAGSSFAPAAQESAPVAAEFLGCSFTDNTAKVDGGAIAILSGRVTIQVGAAHSPLALPQHCRFYWTLYNWISSGLYGSAATTTR